MKRWRQAPANCVTCSIVEQALSLLEPDPVRRAKYLTRSVNFTSTKQSLVLGLEPEFDWEPELEYELFVKDGRLQSSSAFYS